MSDGKNKKRAIFIVSLLVVGNLIGAGILALPMQTGCAGLIFSTCAMVIFAIAMFFTAVTLAQEAIDAKTDNFNYPSLYQKYLGNIGKWLAIVANMLILYGLLTAYLSGGTAIISGVFNISVDNKLFHIIIILILFVILSAFTMCGTKIIAKYNGLLMVILGITFCAIVGICAFHVKPERELFFNLKFLPIAIPVILTAFHFHNIIPSICKHLEWDKKAITTSMSIGMGIGFFMNFIWIAIGIGVLPLTIGNESIVYAFQHGLPATIPISKLLNIPVFNVFATTFAIVAICTSYVANGMGLMDFNRDLLRNSFGKFRNIAVTIATFIPPLIVAIFFPNVFLKAIGIVGGVGIAILFGILPSIVFFMKHKNIKARILAIIMFLLFFAALAFDLANDFNIIDSDLIIEDIKKENK